MSVGVMKDYKLKQKNLRASHTLGYKSKRSVDGSRCGYVRAAGKGYAALGAEQENSLSMYTYYAPSLSMYILCS